MSVSLTVNGRAIQIGAAPRTHLADVLREDLRLTGTHIGCEHGVCGACTVLVDGEPARACLTFPALCPGAEIRTIEGLEDDPVAIRLRAAFSAEHALQCGFCTPGMMVTARDIVLRLPDADDDRVRLELAGNLCRCTGYNGIVRAIRRVLDERLDVPRPVPAPIAAVQFGAADAVRIERGPAGDSGLNQRLVFAVPADTLWAAVQDPALVASAIPGATLTRVDGDDIEGTMAVAFGPVRVRFAGQARVQYEAATRSGRVRGGGADTGGTSVTAEAAFRVIEDGPAASILTVDIDYALRGALAQLAKGRVVALMAGEIAGQFAAALAARIRGEDAPAPAPLSGPALLWRLVRLWFTSHFGKGTPSP